MPYLSLNQVARVFSANDTEQIGISRAEVFCSASAIASAISRRYFSNEEGKR